MANEVLTVHRTLDTQGTLCPLPVIRAQKAIHDVPVGDVLEILATDDGSIGDIPAWAKNTGQQVLEYSKNGGVHRFLIRRQK